MSHDNRKIIKITPKKIETTLDAKNRVRPGQANPDALALDPMRVGPGQPQAKPGLALPPDSVMVTEGVAIAGKTRTDYHK